MDLSRHVQASVSHPARRLVCGGGPRGGSTASEGRGEPGTGRATGLRIVFMGTPEPAVTALECLLEKGHEVAAIVAQPDRPAGRGRRVSAPPVKGVAEARDLPLLQPDTLRSRSVRTAILDYAPQALVVVSYGQILPADLLDRTPLGAVNLHFSLLPRWRGAAPVQRSIAAGETETGVTTMLMDPGLDTGPILRQERVAIGAEETAPELEDRLARAGGPLLDLTLRELAAGRLEPRPQQESEATWAPRVRKEEGEVDWRGAASHIYNAWRAFQPWPGLYTWGPKGRLLLERVRPSRREVASRAAARLAPGEVFAPIEGAIGVACGTDWIVLESVRPEGKRAMPAAAAVNGRYLRLGERLGRDPAAP